MTLRDTVKGSSEDDRDHCSTRVEKKNKTKNSGTV